MELITNYSDFWRYIEKYSEEEQIVIENFVSYYTNIYNGYGNKNCQSTYNEGIQYDTTGELHKLALIGFELFKKNMLNKKIKRSKL